MRILFVFPNNQKHHWRIPLGLAYLIGVARAEGHDVCLYDTTETGKTDDGLIYKIRHFQPQLVCVTMMCTNVDLALDIVRTSKECSRDIKIMVGGPYPNVTGGLLLQHDSIDYLCVGEGEVALQQFLRKCDGRGNYEGDVPGVWFRQGGSIVDRDHSDLSEDLDKLPIAERELFDTRHVVNVNDGAPILTARGCPFLCTYCINPIYRRMYGNKYIRCRNIADVIDEMKRMIIRFNVGSFFIQDETFFMIKERVFSFCKHYEREIGLPFGCMGQVTQIDDEILDVLVKSGCNYIGMGIETGNERLRKEVLKRNIPDSQIIKIFQSCAKRGIKTVSYNIIGLPGESMRSIRETLGINVKCRPSAMQVSIMAPFEGTEIRGVYEEKGWLKNRRIISSYGNSMVDMPGMSERRLLYLQAILPFKYYFRSKQVWMLISFIIVRIPAWNRMLRIIRNTLVRGMNIIATQMMERESSTIRELKI